MKGYAEGFIIHSRQEQHSKQGIKQPGQIESEVEEFLKAGGVVKKYDSYGKEIIV